MTGDDHVRQLRNLIHAANRIVFFGGAGVSTESGIPDFRSVDGLYNQKHKYSPEYMLSHDFFMDCTADFFEFYRSKLLPPQDVKPNDTHIYLSKLENHGKLTAIITQNIDGLHQAAGSKNVLELHGSAWRNYCMDCHKFYVTDRNGRGIPLCECGGIIKPDVVLYGERLDAETLEKAAKYISQAELVIIGGTSLNVYPAAGLLDHTREECKLVIINKSPTQYDHNADLLISDSIGKVFGALEI